MKKVMTKLLAGAVVFGICGLGSWAVAQDPYSNPNIAVVRVVEGNPNTAALTGKPGDLCTDRSSGSVFVYSGTSWRGLFVSTGTASANPIAGSLILSGTTWRLYSSATNGFIINTGTTTPF